MIRTSCPELQMTMQIYIKTLDQHFGANFKNIFFESFCNKFLSFLHFQLLSIKNVKNAYFNQRLECPNSGQNIQQLMSLCACFFSICSLFNVFVYEIFLSLFVSKIQLWVLIIHKVEISVCFSKPSFVWQDGSKGRKVYFYLG